MPDRTFAFEGFTNGLVQGLQFFDQDGQAGQILTHACFVLDVTADLRQTRGAYGGTARFQRVCGEVCGRGVALRDGGANFGAPIRLDDETTLGRVDIELLADGTALASWLEYQGNRAKLQLRRISDTGDRSPAVTVVGNGAERPSGYPRIALSGDDVIVAWTESVLVDPATSESDVRVRTAIASLN